MSVLLVLNNLDSAGLIVNVYGVNGGVAYVTIWSGDLFDGVGAGSEPLGGCSSIGACSKSPRISWVSNACYLKSCAWKLGSCVVSINLDNADAADKIADCAAGVAWRVVGKANLTSWSTASVGKHTIVMQSHTWDKGGAILQEVTLTLGEVNAAQVKVVGVAVSCNRKCTIRNGDLLKVAEVTRSIKVCTIEVERVSNVGYRCWQVAAVSIREGVRELNASHVRSGVVKTNIPKYLGLGTGNRAAPLVEPLLANGVLWTNNHVERNSGAVNAKINVGIIASVDGVAVVESGQRESTPNLGVGVCIVCINNMQSSTEDATCCWSWISPRYGCTVRIFNFNWSCVLCGCELDFIGQGNIKIVTFCHGRSGRFPVDCNMVQIISGNLIDWCIGIISHRHAGNLDR